MVEPSGTRPGVPFLAKGSRDSKGNLLLPMPTHSSLISRLGRGCLWTCGLLIALSFANMLVAWPLASSLGLGHWVSSARGRKDSYTFLFDPGYEWISTAMHAFILITSISGGLLLGFAGKRLKEARKKRIKPPGDSIPQLSSERPEEFYQEVHRQPLSSSLAIDAVTAAEHKTQIQSARLGAATGMALLAGLQLSNAANSFLFGASGPSPGRVALLLLCILPALQLARRFGVSSRVSRQLDERLLLNFDDRNLLLQQIDPKGRATTLESWRFDELRELRLNRKVLSETRRLDQLTLLTQEQGQVFVLAQYAELEAGPQVAPAQARELAQRLGIPFRESDE
jgi:hypothetical protein